MCSFQYLLLSANVVLHCIWRTGGDARFLGTECYSQILIWWCPWEKCVYWLHSGHFCCAWYASRSGAPAVLVGSGGGLFPALPVVRTCHVQWRGCCRPAGDSWVSVACGVSDSPVERGVMHHQVWVVLWWIGCCKHKEAIIQWPQLRSFGDLCVCVHMCVGRIGWLI